MRHFLLFLIIIGSFAYANNSSFALAKQCLFCHNVQAKDWETTWHSRSHYDSNPLYKSVVDYISKTTYQSQDVTLVKCAQCHNPTMSVKEIDDLYAYSIANAYHFETEEVKKVKNSVSDESIKTGISCVICHRTDKIHENADMKSGGYEAVEWVKGNVIVGPFGDERRTTFHTSEKRDHFVNPNKLCTVCHYGSANDHKVELYATGKEYSSVSSKDTCVSCHMPIHKREAIAPQITQKGATPVVRDLRSHLFAGARNSNILKDTFSLDLKKDGNKLVVDIKNLTPHNAPTGFSARSIELKVDFLHGANVVSTQSIKFETTYEDRRGKETLAYVATSLKSDTRIKPYEQKKFSIDRPLGTTSANVYINYRLVNENILNLIELKDPTFTKVYNMNSKSIVF
ncbi:MAG: cytochrome c family protein [Campylobacteraceae bacterium]|nr:cytochrome c family protein [Campylobacteraceae bacterium]